MWRVPGERRPGRWPRRPAGYLCYAGGSRKPLSPAMEAPGPTRPRLGGASGPTVAATSPHALAPAVTEVLTSGRAKVKCTGLPPSLAQVWRGEARSRTLRPAVAGGAASWLPARAQHPSHSALEGHRHQGGWPLVSAKDSGNCPQGLGGAAGPLTTCSSREAPGCPPPSHSLFHACSLGLHFLAGVTGHR